MTVTGRCRGSTMWKHLVVSVSVAVVAASAQAPTNLLFNPDAANGPGGWIPYLDARVEGAGPRACFVLRNRAFLDQVVNLPDGSGGGFAVFTGWGSSDRVDADGSITGLPTLYGLFVDTHGTTFLGHLQGQDMLARPKATNQWTRMSGVFQIPQGTARVAFRMQQAERAGVPQNGSAARFDDLGLYVFKTNDQARTFLRTWTETSQPPGFCGGTPFER